MFKKTIRRYKTMYRPLIKKVVFFTLFGFFLAVLAISLHHHDNSFSLPTCSICKIKTSISGTFSKINIDSAPAIAGIHLFSMLILLCLSGILPDRKTVFIDSQIAVTYPNKAPPRSGHTSTSH
jgi:hypothetical protein